MSSMCFFCKIKCACEGKSLCFREVEFVEFSLLPQIERSIDMCIRKPFSMLSLLFFKNMKLNNEYAYCCIIGQVI